MCLACIAADLVKGPNRVRAVVGEMEMKWMIKMPMSSSTLKEVSLKALSLGYLKQLRYLPTRQSPLPCATVPFISRKEVALHVAIRRVSLSRQSFVKTFKSVPDAL